MTDNDTSSTVQARYGNKVLCCELMILTSSIPLSFWYRNLLFSKSEDLRQLYRRISCYVELTNEEVRVYSGVDEVGRPEGLPVRYKNKVEKLKKTSHKAKTDFARAFGEICEEISFE